MKLSTRHILPLYIFFFLYFFYSASIFGQQTRTLHYIGLKYHHGILINHTPKRTNIEGLALSPLDALEADFQFKTNGRKAWHQSLGYPVWGITSRFYGIHDKVFNDTLTQWGKGVALLAYLNARIIHAKWVEVSLRIGTGIGGFTKNYDAESNPTNLFLSAPVNGSMNAAIETVFKLSTHWYLNAGLTFAHFSNGRLKMPNLGVNLLSPSLGVYYKPFVNLEKVLIPDSLRPVYKKHNLILTFGVGAKLLSDLGTKYYPAYALSLHYGYNVARVSRILIGVDGFMDKSLLVTDEDGVNGADIRRLGLFAGHELLLDKLGVVLGAGRYVYDKTKHDANVYIKGGLRYHFCKHILVGMYLKTHYGQADCLEWTLGAKIP